MSINGAVMAVSNAAALTASNEAMEEYRQMAKMVIHASRVMAAIRGCQTKKVPMVVATPRPPFQRKNTEVV